jgi:hypothetical protein
MKWHKSLSLNKILSSNPILEKGIIDVKAFEKNLSLIYIHKIWETNLHNYM